MSHFVVADVTDVNFGFEPPLYTLTYWLMHGRVCLSEKCDLGFCPMQMAQREETKLTLLQLCVL